MLRVGVLAGVLVLLTALPALSEEPTTGEFAWTDARTRLEFACYVPPNYDPTRHYGLIIALHGKGSAGVHERNGWRWKMGLEKGDFIIACPTLKEFSIVKQTERAKAAILRLLAHLRKQYNIDRGRILLTGFSMGGPLSAGVYFRASPAFSALALRAPAGALPGPIVRRTRDNFKKPLLVIVGERDGLRKAAAKIHKLLKAKRFRNIKHQVVPDVKHSSDPGINVPTLEWFNQQTRPRDQAGTRKADN